MEPIRKLKRAVEIYRTEGLTTLLLKLNTVIFFYWLAKGILIRRNSDCYVMYNLITREKYYVPQFSQHYFKREARRRKQEDYYFSAEDFAPVKSTDTVMNIGAFIGISTNLYAKRADHVIAIEPSPRNRDCLKRNINSDNVTILPYAVGEERGTLSLNLGNSASNDSLLEPDDGGANQVVEVEVRTIEDICDELNITKINILKVEAEGVEPEILKGISDIDVQKIVVNCSPERFGKSPRQEVLSWLESNNFEILEHDEQPVIFGRKSDT